MPKKNIDCLCQRQTDGPRIHGLIQAMLLLGVGEEPRHGYELYKSLSAELPEGLIPDVAVIYRILRKLEQEGFVCSRLAPGSGGPARKVYSLTKGGKDYLARWHETVLGRVKALRLFVDKYENLKSHLHTEEEK